MICQVMSTEKALIPSAPKKIMKKVMYAGMSSEGLSTSSRQPPKEPLRTAPEGGSGELHLES